MTEKSIINFVAHAYHVSPERVSLQHRFNGDVVIVIHTKSGASEIIRIREEEKKA